MSEARNRIRANCAQELLDSAANARVKGQAQYFTPPEWARVLALPLPRYRPVAFDLFCGNGALLDGLRRREPGCPMTRGYGCDVDRSVLPNSPHFAAADVTRLYPLLCAVDWKADLLALNPPWGLQWHRERLADLGRSDVLAVVATYQGDSGLPRAGGPSVAVGKTIDSTLAALCIALDRCSECGEGYLIANADTLERLLFAPDAEGAALRAHCWAYLTLPSNICCRTSNVPTGVLWFARGHWEGIQLTHRAERADLREIAGVLADWQSKRIMCRSGPEVREWSSLQETSVRKWRAALEEYARLYEQRPEWNLWLKPDGTIGTALSLFDEQSGRYAEDAGVLHKLDGQSPLRLVVHRETRRLLEQAALVGPWRVSPDLQAAVRSALAAYERERTPLYPLNPVQRLGYLDEHDQLECVRDLAPFQAGERYPLRSATVRVIRRGTRRNIEGQLDKVEWHGSELVFILTGPDGREYHFMDERLRSEDVRVEMDTLRGRTLRWLTNAPACPIDFTLNDLLEHFAIPEVPDVSRQFASTYQQHQQTLTRIESALQ